MEFQALCELADQEIRLDAHDRGLMAQAMTEAKGVSAVAHQVYWRLRARALEAEAQRRPGIAGLFVKEPYAG